MFCIVVLPGSGDDGRGCYRDESLLEGESNRIGEVTFFVSAIFPPGF
jgi:hypothetical protein